MSLYTIFFYLHLASLAFASVGILYADKLAFSWMRGTKDTLQKTHLLQAHTIVSIALGMLILTGLYLFWPMRIYLLHQPLFYIKMAFVITLVINSFAVGKMMHLATLKTFNSLIRAEKTPLFISGAISTLCWIGAGTTALLLFF